MIYLDNNATTEVNPKVREEMRKWQCMPFNPSSSNPMAQKAKKMIEDGRSYICKVLGTTDKKYFVLYTSGGSESNSLIIRSCAESYKRITKQKPHIVTSAIEHKSVLLTCENLKEIGLITYTLVQPNEYGEITAQDVKNALKPNTCLVSVMYANNETGAINEINKIGNICKGKKIPFHCDAVQAFGKKHINVNINNINAISASGHKIYGPKGVGLLVIEKALIEGYDLRGQICGTQQGKLRGGTENVAGIAGIITAIKEVQKNRDAKNKKLEELKLYTKEKLSEIPDLVFISNERSMPNTLLISVKRTKFCNIKCKQKLEKKNIFVSIGSACNTSNPDASHVLNAMKLSKEIKQGVLRISFGDHNTKKELNEFVKNFKECI